MSSCRDKESMNVVCSNCESALSTMLCVDCIENERYLCENCAEMHTKVKIYKKHRIYMPCAVRNKLKEPVSESAIPPYIAALSVSEYFTAPQCGSFASFCRHVEQWEHQLDDLDFDDVTNTLGLSDGLSMRGALACFFIALSVHILTKYVLGRRAIFATIGVGIVIYRFIKRRQNSYLSELGKIKQASEEVRRSIGVGLKNTIPNGKISDNGCIVPEDESFRFWHESEGKSATLKQRVRKYEPRKKS